MDRHSAINRLYRLVWNESLMIWTAVAEIARGRGKSGTGRRRLAALLALSASVPLVPPAMAGPITPDGRTQTTLSSSGNVTDIHTGTVSGSNAFNSFSTFTVNGGQVVNMHLGGASNLINLVTDGRTTINGMLNAIKNNKIGGNVFFASPKGFVVGKDGVVNVGSLTVSTPAQSFVTDFFLEGGEVDPASLGALLSGSLASGDGSSISVDGTINAMGNVRLLSGSVRIGGTIFRGARFVGLAPDFSDVVNANGLEDGTKIVEENGRIKVVADTGPAAETVAGAGAPAEPGAGNGSDSAVSGTSTSNPVVAATNPAPAPAPAPAPGTAPAP
ncbi:MAG: leukotoxin LktA family filamentous adhesin, partial [Pseudomonadota bacterium]